MLTEEIRNSFLQVLEEGVKPATGCTEPVAVAYAAAVCRIYLEGPHIDRINIRVSANVMKNALAVIVPGTREAGVEVAAAAGALAGNAEAGLKVISELSPDIVPEIISLARSNQVPVAKLVIPRTVSMDSVVPPAVIKIFMALF